MNGVETEGGEGFERVGHEAFAAGFVDGRLHGVDDLDVKALEGGRRWRRRVPLGPAPTMKASICVL